MVDIFNDNDIEKPLKAMSDATRRGLLKQLAYQGTMKVTDLARVYNISLNAISKHIKVLENAKLVKRKTVGRTHWIEVDLAIFVEVEKWLEQLNSLWELRLNTLDNILNQGEGTMIDLAINLTKQINAPVERVFDAWMNAETLSRFMTPMPGMPEPRTEVDATLGGGFTIYMMVGENEIPHSGKYLEVNRPNKLVFTWESPFSTEGSTVTIELSSIDEKTTEINFSHIKFIDEEARSNHEGGWNEILNKLNEKLSESIAA